ncbi:SAV_2336 N-terminal domain-related protein [Micromonospora sp. NPDC001898]|uniref:SAV_2336 N-terminal domain-related protein n=1 Tax=Micromonospora sp. NPDC001898 TaxID=3364221 RepID=UPI0036B09657
MSTVRLVGALRGLDVQPRELADALWLARFLPGGGPPAEAGTSPTPADPADADPAEPADPTPEGAEPNRLSTPRRPRTRPRPTPTRVEGSDAPDPVRWVRLHVPRPAGRPAGSGDAGLPVRAPAPPALDTRALARSLRPLRRRVPDPNTLALDEEATAARVVEQGLWVPVLRPTSQPWFDLTLAVDGGASMAVWRPLVADLESALTRLRAFRHVRRVRLPSGAERRLTVGPTDGPGAPGHSTRELLDPRGRQLILVVSDCAGPEWHDGSMFHTLQTWARHETVAILQPLPQRMWRRSGLVPVRGRLTATGGDSANRHLRFVPRQWRPGAGLRGIVPVPVLQIQPDWLAGWARLTGTGDGTIDAVVTLPPHPGPPAPVEPVGGSPQDEAARRLSRFLATASPEALRLATQLADLPVTLPIMRLVQQASAAPAHPAHLAEVLLGGLLVRQPDPAGDLRFDFHQGIRPMLRDLLLHTDLLRLRHEIARFLARQMGISMREFAAALSAPAGVAGDAGLGQSFGRLPATVLTRLGGRHRELIEFVEQREPDPGPPSPVNGHHPVRRVTVEPGPLVTAEPGPSVVGPSVDEQDLDGLDATIRGLRQATAAGPDRTDLTGLARALRARFQLTGDVTDLVEAASILEQVRRWADGGTEPDDPDAVLDLAEVRLSLCTERGATADLNAAVALFRSALAAPDGPRSGRWRGTVGLARALVVRADRLGTVADLDEAVELYLAAARAAPEAGGDDLRLRAVDALLRRYALTGDRTALTRADAVSGDVADTPGRHSRRVRLADLLRRAARETGEPDLLRRAAALYAEATERSGPDGDARVLHGLAEARGELSVATGDPAELDAAVATARAAVAAGGRDDVTHAECLATLGRLLRLRVDRDGRDRDRDALVDAARRLLDAVPGFHPDRHHHLAALGDALRLRYDAAGDAGDIQEACARYEEAVRTSPASGAELGRRLAGLGDALRARADRFGSRADLDAARQALARAVDVTPADDPRLADRVRLLAEALLALRERSAAVACYRRAVELHGRRHGPDGAPTVEVRVAFGRALLAAERFTEAREELRAVADILAQRLGPGHRRALAARSAAAEALAGLGDLGGARRELRDVLAGQVRSLGADDADPAATRRLLDRLAGDG